MNKSVKNASEVTQACTLISTQLFGAGDLFILKALDAGIWHSKQTSCANLNILFIPTRNKFNLVGVILNLPRLSRRLALKVVILAASITKRGDCKGLKKTRSLIDKQTHLCSLKSAKKPKDSPDMVLSCDPFSIKISHCSSPMHGGIWSWIACHIKGMLLFARCFNAYGFDGSRLLNSLYDGLPIGDLVASSALRLRPYGGGAISRSKLAILEQFINAVAFIEYFNKNYLRWCGHQKFSCAFLARETTYLDAVFSRCMSRQDIAVISIYSSSRLYALYPKRNTPYLHEQTQFRDGLYQLSAEDVDATVKYLSGRINDPSAGLGYMKGGLNSLHLLESDKGVPIALSSTKTSAALFLHSFDDAQFIYGCDGFNDLWDWTTFTIDTLVANVSIDIIVVKCHPNVDYQNYPGDRVAFQRLKMRYASIPKVVWCSANCSTRVFRECGRFAAITHHGSIAEELVYLGVPVIASKFSPWSNNYSFVYCWDNPESYNGFLSCDFSSFEVTVEQQKELFEYVYTARVRNSLSFQDRWPWYDFLEAQGIKITGNFFEDMDLARDQLLKIGNAAGLSCFVRSRLSIHASIASAG